MCDQTGSIDVMEFELAPEAVCIMCVDICKTNSLLKSPDPFLTRFPVRAGLTHAEAPVRVTLYSAGVASAPWCPSVWALLSPSPDLLELTHPE